jgi:predicted nuclease with TOPRIM domain
MKEMQIFSRNFFFQKDLEQALKIIKQLEVENSRLNEENKQVFVIFKLKVAFG